MHNSSGRVVRDPVHGYVEIPAELDALDRLDQISAEWVVRVRRRPTSGARWARRSSTR